MNKDGGLIVVRADVPNDEGRLLAEALAVDVAYRIDASVVVPRMPQGDALAHDLGDEIEWDLALGDVE